MSPLLLDLALARRVERAEARAALSCAQTLARLCPGSGATFESVAGGYAAFCGVNSPVTQAIGVGLNGPVSAEEIDRLEEFFFSRGDAARVELCPLAHSSVSEEFGKRAYRVTEFTNVMARRIQPRETWPSPAAGVTLETVAPECAELWTRVVAEGFAEQHPVTPELLEVMEMFARSAETECYLVRANGEPAGGGALALRDAVAGLFGASTLPAFRNRGVQTALLHARLRRAAEARCDLAVSLARPGSVSVRNILRQGFEVLYTRVKFEKSAPPNSAPLGACE